VKVLPVVTGNIM